MNMIKDRYGSYTNLHLNEIIKNALENKYFNNK